MAKFYCILCILFSTTFLSAFNELNFLPITDPKLAQESIPLTEEEMSCPSIQSLIDDMLNLAGFCANPKRYRSCGALIGLAAPQVGHMKQIVLINTTSQEDILKGLQSQFDIWLNPEIVSRSAKMQKSYEGCYSVPSKYIGRVDRPIEVCVQGYNRHGEKVEKTYTQNLAAIAEHEIEHLKGIRFPEKLHSENDLDLVESPEEALCYSKKWRRWKKKASNADWQCLLNRDYQSQSPSFVK